MKRFEIQFSDDEDKVRANPMDINDVNETLNPDSESWSKLKPYYAIWENDFYIRPTPDETSSTWTTDDGSAIKMWFVEMQDDLSTGSTVPSLPLAFQHILAYGATAKGFRKLRKFTEAREYESLLRIGLTEMVGENAYKDKAAPMGFSIVRGINKNSGIVRP